MFGSQSAYGGYSNSYGNAQPPPPSNTPHYYNHHSNPPPPTDNYDSRAHSNHHHRSDDFRQGLDGGELESGLAQLAVDTNHNNHNNDKDFPQLSGGGSFSTRVSKPSSWASVASQPVKSTPKLLKTKMAVAQGLLTGNSKHLPPTVVVAINSFDTKNGPSKVPPQAPPTQAVPPTGAAPLQSDSPPPQPPQPSQAQAQASREQEPSPGKDDLNDSSEDERSSWNTEMQKHERMNVQQYEREREMAQEKRNDYRDGPRSAPPPIHNQNRGDPRDHQGMTNGGHQQKPAQVYKLRPYDPSTMPPINQHPAQQPYHPGPRSQDRDVDHHHQGYHHQRDQPHHPRDDNYRDGGYGGRPNNYNNNRRDYDGRGGGDNQYQNYRHQNHQNHSGDGGYQNRRYQNPQPYEKANSYQSQQSREDRMERMANPVVASPGSVKSEASNDTSNTHPVLEKLICENNYNPEKFELQLQGARFFIIKSFSEDDVHRSIKYSIWCSTEHGNKRLDTAFRDQMDLGPIYLFFSVNRSGHFCGVAEMKSEVDYRASSGVWSQDKWKGQFQVRWVYVKDVPNDVLRHITLENNEGKPVTNSRDTQEVPSKQGKEVVSIIHHYKHSTSIFDDFPHYEQKQEKEAPPPLPPQAHGLGPHNPPPPPHGQQSAPRDGPMNPMPRDGQADRRRASSPPPLTGPGSGFDRRDRQQNNYGNYQNNNGGAGGRGGYDNQSRPDRNMNYNQQGRGGRAYDNNNGYQPRNNDHYQARSNDGYQRNGNDGYDNRQRNTDGGYQSNRGNYNGGAHNNHMQRDRNAGPNDGYQGQRSQDGGYSNSNAAPAGRPEGYQPRDGGYERRPQRNNDHFRRNNDTAHLERESWRN